MEKLVRDEIPYEIMKQGLKVTMRYPKNEEEKALFLVAKLDEEMREFIQCPSLEEAADVLEVLCAINGGSYEDIAQTAREKRRQKGGFSLGIIMEFKTEE